MEKQKSIAVGMSGGVDSAVSAALLLEQGYRVVGITCDFHPWDTQHTEAADDARAVCDALGIPHYHVDCVDVFSQRIVDTFVRDYERGLTPSPCVVCNRLVKFPMLLEAAREHGCEFIATGHYVQLGQTAEGLPVVLKGKDDGKDQSYMLAYLPREILEHLLLPLGNLTKVDVRAYAAGLNLPVASKQDSQDICFAPQGYRALLDECHIQSVPGNFVNADGRVLGSHTGFSDYTIGQRKGIGIAAPEPLYVLEKRSEDNTILVGSKSQTYIAEVIARDVCWQAFEEEPDSLQAQVKLRYRSAQAACQVTRIAKQRYRVTLAHEQEITAPGQFAVFYNDSCVLGAGIIESITRKN